MITMQMLKPNKEKSREWYRANKEKSAESNKIWVENNRERKKEIANKYACKPWTCDICGKTMLISGMARHCKTLSHMSRI